MSPIASRPIAPVSARWGFFISTQVLFAVLAFVFLAGCGPSVNRYLLIDASLRAHDPKGADAVVQRAEEEYGEKGRVLYGMDRGMTLQLAGEYQQSNAVLEQAEEELDRLYTRRMRTEALAFMTNDTALPYEGDPYEQVLINVLSDRVQEKNAYRDDGFARYLSGILYESIGDVNNAFIAYRKAYETFDATRGWSNTAVPSQLKEDLLRTAEALQFTQELDEYRRLFSDTKWETSQSLQPLAQVVVISYNGRAPRKEDQFLDLPISLNALQLVLLNRGIAQSSRQSNRGIDTVLYGLNGRVVRVALPRLVPQKTQVPIDTVSLIQDDNGARVTLNTELVHNVTALADKALAERMPGIATKALARAATKFALAEGTARAAQQAAGKDAGPWVGLLVGLLTKGLAVASEEADKRSWQTLPDEIHLARVWIPPGRYQVQSSVGGSLDPLQPEVMRILSLEPGETAVLLQRVMP